MICDNNPIPADTEAMANIRSFKPMNNRYLYPFFLIISIATVMKDLFCPTTLCIRVLTRSKLVVTEPDMAPERKKEIKGVLLRKYLA